jgi:hypothetical protein
MYLNRCPAVQGRRLGHTLIVWRSRTIASLVALVNEFLRRFVLHVLPPGFVCIRHFGFLAHRRRGALLPLCVRLLAESSQTWTEAAPEEKAR